MIGIGQPGHIDQIKQANVGAVYRLIDTYGPVSRIALSKYAHLAPASITKIVRELMEAHLVGETEYQENGLRGRPAVGVVVETQAWHFLSLHISHGSLSLSLRELSSKLVVEDTVSLPSQASLPLLTRLIAEVDAFLPAISVRWSDLRLSPSRCPALSMRRPVSYTACRGTMFAICR
ncbi:hypothetical protein SODG_002104 [Sodalis praecaptivus]